MAKLWIKMQQTECLEVVKIRQHLIPNRAHTFFPCWRQLFFSLLWKIYYSAHLRWHWFIWQNYMFFFVGLTKVRLFHSLSIYFGCLTEHKVLMKMCQQLVFEWIAKRIDVRDSTHTCNQIDFSFFLFSFEMLTTLKWVSLHITRTNQYKKPRHRLMVVHRSRIEFFVDLVHWQVTWWIRFGNELWT